MHVEQELATVGDYIAPLGFDHGKNNVRNLDKAWVLTRRAPALWSKYDQADLRFMGMARSGSLTELGRNVAASATLAEVAALWAKWLRATPDIKLPKRRHKNLTVAKRVFDRFWQMKPAVRDYFLHHVTSQDPVVRDKLRAIEVLANTAGGGADADLADVDAVAVLLNDPASAKAALRASLQAYLRNKGEGARNWGRRERRLILEAWRDAG